MARQLVVEKYSRDEWNFGHFFPDDLFLKNHFSFGLLGLNLVTKKDLIIFAKIISDFLSPFSPPISTG
ncbi:MAG: hypothetical protein AMR96_04310 [Candidatus Adiutrix intracellularis]|jgi:hypothetical protein|nr:MAG: hypothetical protein AMR96_04310 [Candidatus Adiutrix intracellularis]MDR2827468.1 hypothetical protein [Candidatus Adiutrix intracellularis]